MWWTRKQKGGAFESHKELLGTLAGLGGQEALFLPLLAGTVWSLLPRSIKEEPYLEQRLGTVATLPSPLRFLS